MALGIETSDKKQVIGQGVTYPTADYIYPSNSGFYNVKKYGAKGDGSTDDTSSIRAAMSEAFRDRRNGGTNATVYFPSGTYIVTDTLLWASYPQRPARISARVKNGCISGFDVSDGGTDFAASRNGHGGLWVTGGGGSLYAASQRGRGLQINTILSGGSVAGVNMNGLSCIGRGFISLPKVVAVNWRSAIRFEGQNKATTSIKLAADTFTNGNCNVAPTDGPARETCKAVLYVASNLEGNATGSGEAGYKNDIWNVTVEVGRGNPGAIGIDWQASNRASIKNVNVISDDGMGMAGLNIARTAADGSGVGPALVKNLSVHGFDYGIYANADANQVGVTFEYIDLQRQRVLGVINGGMPNWFHKVSSINRIPVFVNCVKSPACAQSIGSLAVIDGTFTGGAGDTSAVLIQNNQRNKGVTFLRNIRTSGYKSALAIGPSNAEVSGARIAEWAWPPATPVSGGKSLNLPAIPNTPEFVDNNFAGGVCSDSGHWADVTCYGADRNGRKDSTSGIQSAMASGKPIVYFPFGVYVIDGMVHIPGSVRKVLGLNSVIIRWGPRDKPIFSCDSKTGKSVEIRSFDFGRNVNPSFSNNCTGDLVLADLFNPGSYSSSSGGNRLFIEDVAIPNSMTINNETMYARQFDVEGGFPTFNNSAAWIFGFKTEDGLSTGVLRASDSSVEVIGAAHYLNRGATDVPQYRFENTRFSVADFVTAAGWSTTIANVHRGTTQKYGSEAGGYGGGAVGIGLYSGLSENGGENVNARGNSRTE